MLLLSSDMQLSLPNKKILAQAVLLNNLLSAFGEHAVEIEGRTYYRKPLHILRPKNLESMTISLEGQHRANEVFRAGEEGNREPVRELVLIAARPEAVP